MIAVAVRRRKGLSVQFRGREFLEQGFQVRPAAPTPSAGVGGFLEVLDGPAAGLECRHQGIPGDIATIADQHAPDYHKTGACR